VFLGVKDGKAAFFAKIKISEGPLVIVLLRLGLY